MVLSALAPLPVRHVRHRRAGTRLPGLAGWEVPVEHTGIRRGHRAVRTVAGVFDVSRTGEVESRGPEALAFETGFVGSAPTAAVRVAGPEEKLGSEPGAPLEIDVRGRTRAAEIVPKPLYGREEK